MPVIPPITSITRLNANLRDLFTYIYDLSPLDMEVLFVMIRNKRSMTLEDIAKVVNRDKTTVFRCAQKLYQFGICNKETRSLREGGQYHVYSAVPMEVFKQETENRVKEIEQSFRRIMRGFEKDLETMVSTFYHVPP